MGAIRTMVRLTNTVDEALVRRGELDESKVRTYDADALVDTGATRSVIPANILDQLGLLGIGHCVAEYADGRKERVILTEPILFEIAGRKTQDEALVLGDEVLIGQTVLEKLDLFADPRGQRLFPNPAHPDQPVSKVK